MKIGILEWNTELIMSSVERELSKLGHSVKKFKIEQASPVGIIEDIKIYECDFWITHCYYVFDIWNRGSELENYFEAKKIPVISWYWENPNCSGSFNWLKRFKSKAIPKNNYFFTVDSEHMQLFKNQSLNAAMLPIAIDDQLFDYKCPASQKEKWTLSLSFVGTPCNQMQMEVDSPGEMLDAYINLFFLELFDRMTKNFKEEMEDAGKVSTVIQRVGMPLMLFFSKIYWSAEDYLKAKAGFYQTAKIFLNASWIESLEELTGRIDFIYSWYQLQYYIFNLALETNETEKIRVFGGDAWKTYLLPNYSYETPRLSEDDLLACFSQSKISFCHTKWQFRHALHERPLKILAVGGFPLTDFRSDTADLIGADNIAMYSSLEEAKDKIKFYLSHEDARASMAKRGYEKAYAEHRMSVRMQSLLKLTKNFL